MKLSNATQKRYDQLFKCLTWTQNRYILLKLHACPIHRGIDKLKHKIVEFINKHKSHLWNDRNGDKGRTKEICDADD